MQREPVEHAPTGLSRRGFVAAALAGAGAAAAMSAPPLVRPASARPVRRGPAAHNLVFMVSDGASTGTIQMADLCVRLERGRPSHWASMFAIPEARRAVMDTRAADSVVTDSAAAATAWATGHTVNNGAIGLTPDGRMPTPILVHAAQAGKATGLVTTTRLTHATPAGFACNVGTNRNDERAIASQLVERPIDLLLGGGAHYLLPGLPGDEPGLLAVRTADELAAAPEDAIARGRRLIGLFSDQHMDFELDRPAGQPSLRAMTRAALDRLARAPGGFVLQVEGGRVDHAAHSNDAPSLVRDQVAFDDALGEALEFTRSRTDTLLIVCTDHGNANPGITDYGPRGAEGFERLLRARRSFDWIFDRLAPHARAPDEETLRAAVEEATGVALEREELATVRRALAGEQVNPFRLAAKGGAPLGSVLANHFAVGFVSVNHTADFVELTCLGPGSGRTPGFLRNADLHAVMVRALDLPDARPV